MVIFLQIGIIGGSGLDDPDILEERTERYVVTPFGKVSGSTMCLLHFQACMFIV